MKIAYLFIVILLVSCSTTTKIEDDVYFKKEFDNIEYIVEVGDDVVKIYNENEIFTDYNQNPIVYVNFNYLPRYSWYFYSYDPWYSWYHPYYYNSWYYSWYNPYPYYYKPNYYKPYNVNKVYGQRKNISGKGTIPIKKRETEKIVKQRKPIYSQPKQNRATINRRSIPKRNYKGTVRSTSPTRTVRSTSPTRTVRSTSPTRTSSPRR